MMLRCPGCRTKLPIAWETRPYDLTVCISCTRVLVFLEDLSTKIVTTREMEFIRAKAPTDQIQALDQAIHAVMIFRKRRSDRSTLYRR